MKNVALRGLRLPLCVIACILVLCAFLAIPMYIAYFGMALSATDSASELFRLLHPGKFWAWILHPSIVMSMTIAAGLKMFCGIVLQTSDPDQQEQADPLSRLVCAIMAALSGALLLKCGSVVVPFLHLPQDVVHGPLAWFCQPHDNMVAQSRSLLAQETHGDAFVIVICLYGLGWGFAPTLPVFREKRVIRGVQPASYKNLREGSDEPGRSDRRDPKMK